MTLRTDFDALEEGQRVILYPRNDNPLHKRPVLATYAAGYFYCEEGPDYYLGDVLTFNEGFEAGDRT